MKKRILIIEDEKILANLLYKKLEAEGYEALRAWDGKEGFDLIKKERPDLILLDIIMPEMDGFEVMEEIIKDKELKKIPVIIISNSGQPVELGRAKKLGAKDWLIKAEFDPKEVVDKVKRQLNK
jgi:DNA-binding response OmpR family regulator